MGGKKEYLPQVSRALGRKSFRKSSINRKYIDGIFHAFLDKTFSKGLSGLSVVWKSSTANLSIKDPQQILKKSMVKTLPISATDRLPFTRLSRIEPLKAYFTNVRPSTNHLWIYQKRRNYGGFLCIKLFQRSFMIRTFPRKAFRWVLRNRSSSPCLKYLS